MYFDKLRRQELIKPSKYPPIQQAHESISDLISALILQKVH